MTLHIVLENKNLKKIREEREKKRKESDKTRFVHWKGDKNKHKLCFDEGFGPFLFQVNFVCSLEYGESATCTKPIGLIQSR